MANSHRNSMDSLGSMGSSATNIDVSFMSLASTSSSCSNGFEIESEVGREALKEICCSALSRVLDFPDCQLETLLGYDEELGGRGENGGNNVAKNIAASFRIMKRGLSALSHKYHSHHQSYDKAGEDTIDTDGSSIPRLTFGAPLSDDSQVALLQLITHIHSFSTHVGIFRKPGNKNRMENLVQELGEKMFGDIITSEKYNAHDFASVLKQYLSELPEPILLKRHLDAYLQASALSSASSTTRCLQLLMLLLPPVHRVVLQHLLDLLSQVASCQDNKMDAHNLALVFAPTLFLASKSESLPPTSLEKLSSLLRYMIENSEEIFEVPVEVQVVAERYCKKRKSCRQGQGQLEGDGTDGEDIPLEQYSTCCKRECLEDFHQSGQDRAAAEVASLYEVVKNMPDGPQKTHFLKRFESANRLTGTPNFKTPSSTGMFSRRSKSCKKNKENATPNIKSNQSKRTKPCFKKGSLIQEFDQVDNFAPCKSTPVVYNPQTPTIQRLRVLPTNSPMVTDV